MWEMGVNPEESMTLVKGLGRGMDARRKGRSLGRGFPVGRGSLLCAASAAGRPGGNVEYLPSMYEALSMIPSTHKPDTLVHAGTHSIVLGSGGSEVQGQSRLHETDVHTMTVPQASTIEAGMKLRQSRCVLTRLGIRMQWVQVSILALTQCLPQFPHQLAWFC